MDKDPTSPHHGGPDPHLATCCFMLYLVGC